MLCVMAGAAKLPLAWGERSSPVERASGWLTGTVEYGNGVGIGAYAVPVLENADERNGSAGAILPNTGSDMEGRG